MSSADGQQEKALLQKHVSASSPTYTPPAQFREISMPPLLAQSLDNAELWLVRIQDNQLKPDECKGKQVALRLNAIDGKMGCFENSKGSSFEILDLQHIAGVKPFAFLPKGDSSLEVRRVSRQVSIVRSLDSINFTNPSTNGDQGDAHGPDGLSNGRSLHKQKQVPSLFSKGERGLGATIKEESHAVSASLSGGVGAFSTLESLQDDEERISTGKLGKSSKKSRREQPTSALSPEVEISQLRSSQKDLETHEEHTSSKKKSRKHKKMKQEESG